MWKRLTDQLTPQEWNQFVAQHGPTSGRFLQSWEWGEFQKAVGETVERYIFEEDKKVNGVAQVIIKKIPGFGSYAYCPRGPIVAEIASANKVGLAMTELAGALGSILFLRSELPADVSADVEMKKTIDLQPSHTWITELTLFHTGENMSSLHQKTRYNIKLAERHGVQIEFDTRTLEEVWPLFQGTSGRGKFRLHEKNYYKKMLEVLKEGECRAHLVTAVFENNPVAANIMIDFAGVRTYLHGASSYEHRALMAPHLLHWNLMNDARQKGFTHYDWWGVSPENDPNHPWAGISRFKRSFPGEDLAYPGTYDLVKSPVWYTLYRLARRIRRL